MPTRAAIIDGMQFAFLNGKTINTTAAAAYEITYQWAGTSRPADLPRDEDDPNFEPFTGWTEFSETEKAAVRAMMDHIETFANVSFVEVSGNPDPVMNLGKVDLTGTTAGIAGYSASASGDMVTVYDAFAVYDNTIDISNGYDDLILHELGHALGLKHPFSSPTVPAGYDSNKWTVMSYTENLDNGLDSTAMQVFDILAIQDLWGQNDEWATGDDTYTGSRTSTIDTVWDAGGIDTFDGSGWPAGVRIDLREGRFSNFSGIDDVAIAYDTVIENAIGSDGRDRIIGNGVANELDGGRMGDRLFGKNGADLLLGRGGKDRLFGDNGRDRLKGGGNGDTLSGGKGKDTLWGGKGDDEFLFADAGGTDIIKDFEDGVDTLVVDHVSVATVDDVLALGSDVDGNAIFTFSDGKVKIIGLSVADLADDISIA